MHCLRDKIFAADNPHSSKDSNNKRDGDNNARSRPVNEFYEGLNGDEKARLKRDMRYSRHPGKDLGDKIFQRGQDDDRIGVNLNAETMNARHEFNDRMRNEDKDAIFVNNEEGFVNRLADLSDKIHEKYEERTRKSYTISDEDVFKRTDEDPLKVKVEPDSDETRTGYMKSVFREAVENSKKIKENYDRSQFLSDSTSGMHGGPHNAQEYQVNKYTVLALVLAFIALMYLKLFWRENPEDLNPYLKGLMEEKRRREKLEKELNKIN